MIKKIFTLPFKFLAIFFGVLMMVSVFFVAMTNGKSIKFFCDKMDMIMDKLEELSKNQ